MTNTSLFSLYLFHAHVVLSIIGILGFVFFYQWAVRTLPAKALKTLAIWCFVIGGIGVALTVPFCLAGMRLLYGMGM